MVRAHKVLLAVAHILLAGSAFAAPILNLDSSGKLRGATGIDVQGTLYDVVFVDGSCASVFNGCDAPDDLDFTNQDDAANAAAALLNVVLRDKPLGLFSSEPELTFGCDSVFLCNVLIPWRHRTFSGRFVSVVAQNNFPAKQDVRIRDVSQWSIFRDLSDPGDFLSQQAVFTRWSVQAVSEPSTLGYFVVGFFALLLSRRRVQ